MHEIPYNSYSWFLGFIALFAFSLRSLAAYNETGNQVAKIYSRMSMAFAFGFLFFAIPMALTLDPAVLTHYYPLSEIPVQIAVQLEIWLLWFIGLRSKIHLRYLLMVSIPLSIIIIGTEIATSHFVVTQNPLIATSVDILFVSFLKSLLYIMISWPLGFFFIAQAKLQPTLRAKITSVMTGLVFLIVSLGAVASSFTSGGGDTYSSTVIDGILFVMFSVVNLMPRRIISFEHRTSATST
ncbi:MAG: hypothetical protein ABIS59_00720 [Candidatus Saccharibacteria bacterium]